MLVMWAEGEGSLADILDRQGSAASVLSEESEAKLPRQPSRVAFGTSYKPRPKTPSGSTCVLSSFSRSCCGINLTCFWLLTFA